MAEGYDNGIAIYIDGKPKVKLITQDNGRYKVSRMSGCGIGDYFSALSYLMDIGLHVDE